MPSLESLEKLSKTISKLDAPLKLALLNDNEDVKKYLELCPGLQELIKELPLEKEIVLKAILAIGQGEKIFSALRPENKDRAKYLLGRLLHVERFYDDIGGIIGYHYRVLQLMKEKREAKEKVPPKAQFERAPGIDLVKEEARKQEAILEGIKHLDAIAEIYPVGGAGDRLGLVHEEREEALPAACLPFAGRTLLEGLMRDLAAREYLYYKLFGKEIITPVALMTSHEKNNHEHILKIFDENNWFGRPKESFFFFIQPLVPVTTESGHWIVKEDFQLVLKPGGHGVIWKLAKDHGVFSWLENLGRKKIILRQINNPIAGTDGGLLAFIGVGCKKDKAFGFLSCERRVGSAEGVLVLMYTSNQKHCYRISNLEYTDFEKHGIQDYPENKGSLYSFYPSNTNLLFADIEAIQKAMQRCRIPGLLINLRSHETGQAGRLESTMQNIADYIETCFDQPLSKEELEEKLDTFVLYNKRDETISVTKNAYIEGKSFYETPESAFYDILKNNLNLLRLCGMQVPAPQSIESYLKEGPNCIFLYHPFMGPLYHIIRQKIKGGKLFEHGELQLEVAELFMENVEVAGSLFIETPFHLTKSGRCHLKNVRVENKGRKKGRIPAWKNRAKHEEKLQIYLHEGSEFVAENVVFKGNCVIEVPSGVKMTAQQKGEEIVFKEEKIEKPTWQWHYSCDFSLHRA